jgi:hypothetical protein
MRGRCGAGPYWPRRLSLRSLTHLGTRSLLGRCRYARCRHSDPWTLENASAEGSADCAAEPRSSRRRYTVPYCTCAHDLARTKLPGLGNSRYYDAVTLCAIVSQLRLLSGAAACAAQHILAHPEDEGGAQAAGLRNRAESRRRCGRDGPSPGADVARVAPSPAGDVARVRPVLAQMWQEVRPVPAQMCARSRRRCGRGAPSPGADVARVGLSRRRCCRGAQSPGADVRPVPAQVWQGCAQSRRKPSPGLALR